ncbi:MAG: hypothetical protein JXQ75_17625 [Phycisphaerae bacterium]|nr:hypothetical protein [Phycisphaerae bacterium]
MILRATRAALEILGRGATERLNATRAAAEVLGRGATNRTHVTRIQCEVLGEYVCPTAIVTTVRGEVLGHGSTDGIRTAQVQCEILGEQSVPTVRVTLLDSEVLGHGENDGLQATQIQCEVLGEQTVPGLRITAIASEILGSSEAAAVRATQVQCEILGEQFVPTLRLTAFGSEVLGCGNTDRIHNTQLQCEVLGEFGRPELRVTTLAIELLANAPYYGLGMIYYGTLVEADSYFASRLHERAWFDADPADRPKALWAATQIIDALNYKGNKHSVYTLLLANPSASQDEIRAAEVSQPLEFPRGADTTVPEAVRIAVYEIAHALLDGKDPELELENLAINAMGYGAVKTSYERSQLPIEHIVNMVPSSAAWRLLKPFLRDSDALKLLRLS